MYPHIDRYKGPWGITLAEVGVICLFF